MSGYFYFNKFQLDVLQTRLSSGKLVTKAETEAIATLLQVEEIKVYQWFRNKQQLRNPQVDLQTRVRIELLLTEASNKACHGTTRMQGDQLKRLQEIYLSGEEFDKDELARELGVTPKKVARWFRSKKNKGRPDKKKIKRDLEKRQQTEPQLTKNRALNYSGSGAEFGQVSESSLHSNSDDWFSRLETMPEPPESFHEPDMYSNNYVPHTSSSEYHYGVMGQEFYSQPTHQESALEQPADTFSTSSKFPSIHPYNFVKSYSKVSNATYNYHPEL